MKSDFKIDKLAHMTAGIMSVDPVDAFKYGMPSCSHQAHKRAHNKERRLCASILDLGIKECDRFIGREEWLDVICTLAGVTAKRYNEVMDYIYGPINKEGETYG